MVNEKEEVEKFVYTGENSYSVVVNLEKGDVLYRLKGGKYFYKNGKGYALRENTLMGRIKYVGTDVIDKHQYLLKSIFSETTYNSIMADMEHVGINCFVTGSQDKAGGEITGRCLNINIENHKRSFAINDIDGTVSSEDYQKIKSIISSNKQ